MRPLIAALALVLAVAACSDTADTTSTTTTVPATTTTVPAPTTTTTTTTTTLPEAVPAGLPDDFDAGSILEAEVKSQLPRSYLRLGFADAVVLVDTDGTPLGHVPGRAEGPENPMDRLEHQTDELRIDQDFPEGCLVDATLGADQLRILCAPVGEALDRNPTVEVLLASGERVVVADLPEPPEDLTGAFRLGHFLEVFPMPGSRSVALAQFSAECEVRLAVMIGDGDTRHIDGTGWWDDAYPAGEAIALGWTPDRRAMVWRFNGPCSEELDRPGIYAYDTQGAGELLIDTPPELNWVQLVVGQARTGTAAIYPARTDAEIEVLLLGDDPLPLDIEIVEAFARDLLGVEEVSARSVTDGTDVTGWVVEAGGLTLSVTSQIIAWQEDGDALVAVVYASSIPDDEWFLVADINDREGSWTAQFAFPALGDEATVTLASGDWRVEATTGDGEVRLDLPGEPGETPRLTITYRENGAVVGFHGMLLPAGEFAAG